MPKDLALNDKLRNYQRSATAMCRRYLKKFKSFSSHGCAVVCHPTGSGKTAIMGALTQGSAGSGSSLIVTTRKPIRDQLFVELSSNLFVNKFELGEKSELPKVAYLIASCGSFEKPAKKIAYASIKLLLRPELQPFARRQVDRLIEQDTNCIEEALAGRAILITTVQLLQTLHREGATRPIYQNVKTSIKQLLFDEGHYEPALTWSEVIRGLKKPTILFSATPFRNDFRPFLVKADYFDIYHYRDAIKEKRIRTPIIEKREKASTPDKFFRDVKTYCEDKFGARDKWPRVVICCQDYVQIIDIGKKFASDGFKVVAVHDTFHNPTPTTRGPEAWQYRDVPPPNDTDATIWIHQRKLLEGIDDSRLQVLAFYDQMRNGRELVQQIGRVLRIGGARTVAGGEKAYILDHSGGRIEKDWKAFLDYDLGLNKKTLVEAMSRAYLKKFLELHPKVDYVDGTFRRRFDLENFAPVIDEILIKRQANFLQTGKKFDFNKMVKLQVDELNTSEAIVKLRFKKRNCAVIVSLTQQNPEFLNSCFYSEMRHNLRVIIYLADKEVIAVSDALAAGLGPILSDLRPLPHARLVRALAPARLGRAVAVSSRNTNVSNRVVRSRTVRAPSLVKVAPSVDDYGHVLSIVQGWDATQHKIEENLHEFIADEGYDPIDAAKDEAERLKQAKGKIRKPDLIRRYVSVSTGRISETGSPLRLGHYRAWIESLVNQMSREPRASEVENMFERFAPSIEPPIDTLAKNLLLDFYDAQEEYGVLKDPEAPEKGAGDLDFDDLCINRHDAIRNGDDSSTAIFIIKMNEIEFRLLVTYNQKSGRYRIDCKELDEWVRAKGSESKPLFTRHLNSMQSFSIVPEDQRTVYVQGEFYAPGVRTGKDFDENRFFAGRCLIPCAKLAEVDSEKGRVVRGEDRKELPPKAQGYFYAERSLFNIVDQWSENVAKDLGIKMTDTESTTPKMINSLVQQFSFNPNILVCDDMQDESCDFILANDELGIIAMVHAKYSEETRPYSASAMQTVCAQAQKNANLYSFFTQTIPGNYRRWDEPHRFDGLMMKNRVRIPSGGSKVVVWNRIESMLRNPQTTKEIWILVGNMLSVSKVRDALKEENTPGEVIQLNHLIETTIAASTALGAKLRIFCTP